MRLILERGILTIKHSLFRHFAAKLLLPHRNRRKLFRVESFLQNAAQILVGDVEQRQSGAVIFVKAVGGVERLLRLALREQAEFLSGYGVLGVQLVILPLQLAMLLEVFALPVSFFRKSAPGASLYAIPSLSKNQNIIAYGR